MLALYDFANSLPLGGVDGDFSLTENEIRNISHTSSILLETQLLEQNSQSAYFTHTTKYK